MLTIRPIKLKDANAYVKEHHRHNTPTSGHKWSLSVWDNDRLAGVAIAGRPVARYLDDDLTIEIRRVCTDGTHNACSVLYGACAKTAKAMGYQRIITYTLETEPGSSLKAAGFVNCGLCGGGTWSSQNRKRDVTDQDGKQKYETIRKIRWEKRFPGN